MFISLTLRFSPFLIEYPCVDLLPSKLWSEDFGAEDRILSMKKFRFSYSLFSLTISHW